MESDSARDLDPLKVAEGSLSLSIRFSKPYVQKQVPVRVHPKHQNNHTGANSLEIELRRRPHTLSSPAPELRSRFAPYHRQLSSPWFPTREKDSSVDLPRRERERERTLLQTKSRGI